MTVLRQRMVEDMRLRGLSANTQSAYLRAVRMCAAYFHNPPDQFQEADLRHYLRYLQEERKLASASFGVHLAGLRFFFRYTVPRAWPVLDLVRAVPEQKLPVVLTRKPRSIPSYGPCGDCVIGPVWRRFIPVVCASARASFCGCRILIVPRWSYMSPRVRGIKPGRCPCLRKRWNFCGAIGAPIAIRSGCFLL